MNTNRICMLLLAGSLSAAAQSVAERPAYARFSLVHPMDNFRAYLGAKTPVFALELGYDFAGPDDWVGIGAHLTYLSASGKAIERYGGLTQSFKGFRLGGDLRFKTSVPGLTPFLGLHVSSYRGTRDTAGTLPNYDAPTTPYQVAAGSYPETELKFGARAGIEYRFNSAWGICIDYSFSEWRSDYRLDSYTPASGPRTMDGVNPLNPSWIAASVQYRFSIR